MHQATVTNSDWPFLRPTCPATQVYVHRCGLHSQPGRLPFTFYPAMPGNSTACPQEKWEVQRPAMAAAVGEDAADRRFQGAARCALWRAGGRLYVAVETSSPSCVDAAWSFRPIPTLPGLQA